MLQKRYRLKSPRLFKYALRSKRLCVNRFFSVYALPLQDVSPRQRKPCTQFGLIVSKKVDKRANRRNLIKRRLREIIRTNFLLFHPSENPSTFFLNQYQAVVVIARSDIHLATY
ncbi:MAG: ribonuclease P protein component, partial [Cyanobacteria bacterium]|nr:ribonuclease P protein component [Cyanobacteriota bacterium]